MNNHTLIVQSSRLIIRQLSLEDAPFTLSLLNEPSWIEFIGDKNVHSIADAEHYLNDGPLAMYARHGLGMYLVAAKDSNRPVGMCGLLKRDTLQDVDLGLAFLPEYWGAGYASEAARAVLDYGRKQLQLARIVAITLPGNTACIALLERLGFAHEENVSFEPDNEVLRLYGLDTASLRSDS
ncbi:MAG: GNAT family N-acetyltransferase [Pseudomonadales bacterium]